MRRATDLSEVHEIVGDLFPKRIHKNDLEEYALSKEQIEFFNENGYLSGIRVLEDWQIDRLKKELEEIADPAHPLHHLYYEFHSNESTDPSTVLFHALGAWRITAGYHDVLWNPRFLIPASQ